MSVDTAPQIDTGTNPGQPKKHETMDKAKQIAEQRGQERRQRMSGLLGGVKDKLNKMVNFVFGAPEAASYLADEAGKKVENGINRGLDYMDKAADRFVNRVNEGADKLNQKHDQIVKDSKSKIQRLGESAKKFGLGVAARVDGIVAKAIYGIPEFVNQFKADMADAAMGKQAEKMQKLEQQRRAEIQKQIDAINNKYYDKGTKVESAKKAIADRSRECHGNAQQARLKQRNFGVCRDAISSL